MDYISRIPEDMQKLIRMYLRGGDILSLSITCKNQHKLLTREILEEAKLVKFCDDQRETLYTANRSNMVFDSDHTTYKLHVHVTLSQKKIIIRLDSLSILIGGIHYPSHLITNVSGNECNSVTFDLPEALRSKDSRIYFIDGIHGLVSMVFFINIIGTKIFISRCDDELITKTISLATPFDISFDSPFL